MKNLLSPFEQKTLRLYLSGISYEDIAKAQGTTPKAVDNALQRVRRKLREIKH
ncbi:MAG: sigma factor-like helix-turn-helix DNA-binding protein [Hydrogenoanaerobacterium sp.]